MENMITSPTSANEDSKVCHDSIDHHMKKVHPNFSVPPGTDNNEDNRGPVVAVADDVSRTEGVIIRRQAAQLEAILGGSLLFNAMRFNHSCAYSGPIKPQPGKYLRGVVQHGMEILGGGDTSGVVSNE